MSGTTLSERTATAHMQRRRRRLKALGEWQDPFVDAEPVRQHLKKINAAGMPVRAICEQLGLPHESSLQCVLWGRGAYGPSQQIRRETAELVLAYWPSPDHFPDTALIDATGTRRRVQALAVRGWSYSAVARHVGMWKESFRKAIKQRTVTARLARAVRDVYDALWNQDPLEHGVSLNAVSRVRASAAREGWSGPLAWDDDTIEDPAAVPLTDAETPAATEGGNLAARWLMGESVILDRPARDEVITHLYEWTNDTTAEIAERLEMTPCAVEQVWNRIKRKAREAGGPVPWRRVYVPRERTLKKNDMEEAA